MSEFRPFLRRMRLKFNGTNSSVQKQEDMSHSIISITVEPGKVKTVLVSRLKVIYGSNLDELWGKMTIFTDLWIWSHACFIMCWGQSMSNDIIRQYWCMLSVITAYWNKAHMYTLCQGWFKFKWFFFNTYRLFFHNC